MKIVGCLHFPARCVCVCVHNPDFSNQNHNFFLKLFSIHIFFLQSFPFFGVVPAIVDEHGNELEGACEGFLVQKTSH